VVRAAAKLCKSGKVYPLGLPIRDGYPERGYRKPPRRETSLSGNRFAEIHPDSPGVNGAEDYYTIGSHFGTHMDSLAHVWHGKHLYNGFPGASVASGQGALRCGIEKQSWIVARGVMLDMARHMGVESVPPGHAFSSKEILACAKRQGLSLRTGDALLVRTGWMRGYKRDPAAMDHGEAGIGKEACALIKARGICAVGSDNAAIEPIPWAKGQFLAVHVELLRNQGVPLLELLDLDQLAAERVYEFLLVVAPLPVVGGTGSPINPIAIA
jgi:kynurenine formamidase